MVAAFARDDLLLFGLTAQVVVIPNQLRLGLVRIGPGQSIEHFTRLSGSHLDQPARQDSELLGRMSGIAVIIGQLIGLSRDGLSDLGATIANVHTVETGKTVNVAAAGCILNANALPAGHDRRITHPSRRKVLELGEWMQNARSVELRDGLHVSHVGSP